jgi:hypothetical protein
VTVVVGTAPVFTSATSGSTGMRIPFDFTVVTTGDPTASLTYSGTLPPGLTFTDNGDGTAHLTGIVPAGGNGTYPLTFTATNGIGSPVTQSFALTVTTTSSAPAITSSAADTETFGVPFSYTTTTNGYPAPTLTKTGTLPSGVTFTDNGDGTATIAGTAANSAAGSYPLNLKAKSTAGTASQSFILTITKAPVLKNIAATVTAHAGAAFSMTITAKGFTTPTVTESGTLPAGLTFTDNGNGTATIAGTPAAASGGAYTITVTATNQLGTSSDTFTLKVNELPTITSASTAVATAGSSFSFSVTAMGFPTPTISKSGTLPKGLTYKASTGTISGTPKAGSAGTYPLTFTVKNSSGAVTQTFVLTVH